MTRKRDLEIAKFDSAVSDAFRGGPECGRFGTFDDLRRRRMVNDILRKASERDTPDVDETSRFGRGLRTLMFGAAAAIVLGGFIVAVVLVKANQSERASVMPLRDVYYGEVQAASGRLFFGESVAPRHAPIPVGRSIHTTNGSALLRLPTGIDWQMKHGSHGRIASLDPETLTVELLSGENWFRVDPARVGPAFSVETELGRIDVTGTIFVVNVEPSDIRVSLLKGDVWVSRDFGQRVRLKAGHGIHLGDGRQYALASAERKRMHAELGTLDWQLQTTDRVSTTTTAEAAPSASRVEARAVAPSGPSGPLSAAKRDFRHLQKEIQTSRKRRDWGRVATLYERLIQSAPGSEAANVSRVSLGEIYLTKLGRYNDALRQFNTYLRTGHAALVPEAFYGKCGALNALGKRVEEVRCLDEFIRRFDSAFQTPDAKARLQVLRPGGRR